jgi:hypothetical protein
MSEALLQLLLTFLGTIALYAMYWTLWKIHGELIEGRKKLQSDLSEIRKSLESKADKA